MWAHGGPYMLLCCVASTAASWYLYRRFRLGNDESVIMLSNNLCAVPPGKPR